MKHFYMLLLGLLICTLHGSAQYTVTTIESSQYTALTKDNSNNIYGVRLNHSTGKGEIVKYTSGNATPAVIYGNLTFAGGLAQAYPWGLAVNAAGDLFVTNPDETVGWQIIKLTAPSYTATVVQSGRYFSTLAIDRSNNLLSMEYNNATNHYRLVRYSSGAENMAGTVLWNGVPLPAGLNTTYPWGIVCDSHDNIYVLDFPVNNGGQLWKLTAPGFGAAVLGSNKVYTALAIDAADNIYTTEFVNSTTYRVMKYADPAGTGTQLYSGLSATTGSFPLGLVVNNTGTVYAGDMAAAPNGRLITLAPPGITVSSVNRSDANPSNATSVQYTVTFSGAASNVTASSFGLTTTGLTGASITNVSGSGSTYTVTVNTGTGDGTIRLDVNGTGITPSITNVPFTGGQVYTIDKTAPTGTITINSGATATNNAGVVLTITANDNTAMQMQFNNDGGAYSAYENLAATKNWMLAVSEGTKTVNMQLRDQAGNVASFSDQIILDLTAPTTNLITQPANPSTSSTAVFSFDASETGCTFEGSLDGGAFTAVSSPLTLTGLADGSHSLSVRARDAAGNIGAPANYTWTIDANGPIVTSVNVPANGYYKAGQVLTFTVGFNENTTVTGTPGLPVTIGATTVQATYTSGSGSSMLAFAYTVQPGDHDMDGIQVGTNLQLNGGSLVDAIGNNASLTLNNVASTNLVRVNTVIPSVTLSTTAPAQVNTPFTVTITFSEAVTGFTVSDINVLNAAISNLQTTDNISYTVLITPTGDRTYTISVPANAAFNVGNNGNTASNTLSIVYDATAPVITSVNVPANGYYKAGDVLTFVVTFDGPVALNTAGGTPYLPITIGATTVNAAYVGAGANTISFRYTVVNGDQDMDGIAVAGTNLIANGSTIRDAAGNNANLTLNNVGATNNIFVNTVIPTVTISGTPALNGPWTATITFSENVTGFTAADITTTNATISNLQAVNGFTYTVTVTPAAEGQVTMQVPANIAQNIGGNGNSASSPFSYIYDISAPVITSVTVPANGVYKAGDQLNFRVNFSEQITVAAGTPTLEIALTSGTVQATMIANSGSTIDFRYTVQPGDMDANGIALNALGLNGSTIKDAANNNANTTLNSVGNTSAVIVNTGTPSVTISLPAPFPLNAAWTATITFSEAVTGFTAGDLSVTNATASNLQTADNIVYTVLITPVAEGGVGVQVPAHVAVNNASTGNTVSNNISYLYDPNPPVITSVAVPVNGYYKAGDVLTFTINWNENVRVSGAPTLPVVIGSSTVQAMYTGGTAFTNALTFSYTVQAGDMDLDGISLGSSLQLNSATIIDQSTNNAALTLQNPGNTAGVFVHTAHPAVTLSTTAAARVNTAFTVTVVFNEAVTALSAGDFTVANGTASNLQTSDNITYTLLVTPAADGSVSIQLPAGSAINIAGNDNQLSNTITVNYDATAPVITAAQNFSILQNSSAGTPVGKVTATEATGTLQNWLITSDASGGAFAIDGSGNLSVQNGTILNNNVGNTVTIIVTVSDGLNTSAATPVAITIAPINKAPVLDAISNVSICATTDAHTIQVNGASAVEPAQTYTLSISSNEAYFDALTINNAGLISYRLKNSVTSGAATITVTIKDNGGTANGGIDTYQRSFTITVNPLPVITITSDKGNSISKGDIAHLTATGGATYAWEANSSIVSGQQSAIAEVRPQANTIYRVTATSALGCSSTAAFNMSIIEDFKVDATNVLTPNGDGKNDRWVIRNIDSYPDNELKIFDRAGRLVYSQRNYNNTWDGKLNGHPLAEGTYYYFLSISGGAKTAKGYITIILKAN
ncbi:Ig-like domain-containing protein [Longitalea arenae]|uniref:Ig-like domain-containing protein n=1 Tax=Longitalea arenae TaxID=2812558 RepID=UPI0019686BCE|nr:Ig-like domain-containing protein [Longitalea arenae]